jgi:hypothetical protein
LIHARWSSNSEGSVGYAALSLLTFLIALPFGAAMLSFPQILMAVLVRRVRAPVGKAIGALASLALSIWYAVWAAGADLSGNSTASFALVFYPIMIQGWPWLAAFLVVAGTHLYSRDRE